MDATIRLAMDRELAVVTLARPAARNAVDRRLAAELCAALAQATATPAVHGIVLTGAGDRAFCAGVDLKEARTITAGEIETWFGGVVAIYRTILMADKPVVAALNGVATGAGFQMALVCDLRVGHSGTRMGQPEINVGIPSIMGSYWMSLHLGRSLSQELSLTGRLMDADECRRLGLLNQLVPAAELLPQALAVCRELAAKPPTALRHTKAGFRATALAGIDAAFRAAVHGQQEAYAAGEPQALMARFAERRG